MRYFLLSIMILFSCAQVKYSSKKNQDFSNVKIGVTYVVFGENGFRKRLTITSTDGDTVTGTDKQGQTFTLEKAGIEKIRKNNTGGTVALVYGGSAIAATLFVFYLFARGMNKAK